MIGSGKFQFILAQVNVFVNHFNFTVLHSISLFCTDLGLIDMLLTNQNAEIVACILLVKQKLRLLIDVIEYGSFQ